MFSLIISFPYLWLFFLNGLHVSDRNNQKRWLKLSLFQLETTVATAKMNLLDSHMKCTDTTYKRSYFSTSGEHSKILRSTNVWVGTYQGQKWGGNACCMGHHTRINSKIFSGKRLNIVGFLRAAYLIFRHSAKCKCGSLCKKQQQSTLKY